MLACMAGCAFTHAIREGFDDACRPHSLVYGVVNDLLFGSCVPYRLKGVLYTWIEECGEGEVDDLDHR